MERYGLDNLYHQIALSILKETAGVFNINIEKAFNIVKHEFSNKKLKVTDKIY